MISKTNWSMSAGGPFVLIPKSLVASWNSSSDDKDDFTLRDYNAIEAAQGMLSMCAIRKRKVFVFNEGPMPITTFPFGNHIYFARWIFGRGRIDKQIGPDIVNQFDKLKYISLDQKLVSMSGLHYLFDAAICGQLPLFSQEAIRVEFQTGKYAIESAEYVPFKTTKFIIHRFVYTSSSHL